MTKYTCLSCGKDSYSADPHQENEPCIYCGNHGAVASADLNPSPQTPCEICDPKVAPVCTKECQAVCPETDTVGDKCEICGSVDRLSAVICKPVANSEFVAKATLCRDCKSTYASGYIRFYYSDLPLAQNLVKNHQKRFGTIAVVGNVGIRSKRQYVLRESITDELLSAASNDEKLKGIMQDAGFTNVSDFIKATKKALSGGEEQ